MKFLLKKSYLQDMGELFIIAYYYLYAVSKNRCWPLCGLCYLSPPMPFLFIYQTPKVIFLLKLAKSFLSFCYRSS